MYAWVRRWWRESWNDQFFSRTLISSPSVSLHDSDSKPVPPVPSTPRRHNSTHHSLPFISPSPSPPHPSSSSIYPAPSNELPKPEATATTRYLSTGSRVMALDEALAVGDQQSRRYCSGQETLMRRGVDSAGSEGEEERGVRGRGRDGCSLELGRAHGTGRGLQEGI